MRSSTHRLSKFLPFALLFPFALANVGCDQDTLVVGAVLPLSGPEQANGEEAKRGLELALEKVNTDGNRLELVVVDSQSNPAHAAQQAEKLFKEQNAVAVVGGTSTLEARALATVAESAEKILMVPSAGDQQISKDSKHVYRISVSDAAIGSKLAAFAHKSLNAETAVIWGEDDQFVATLQEGFESTFQNLGGESLGARTVGPDELGEAEEISDKKSDVIVLNGQNAWLQSMVTGIRERGYKGKLLAPQAFSGPANLESMGRDARGVMFAYAPLIETYDTTKSFIAEYEQKFGTPPSLYAAEAFDSLQVLAAAARDKPPIVSEIRRGLRDQVKDFSGVTGSLEFDDSGAVKKFPRVYSLDDQLTMRDHEDLMEEIRAERERKIKEIRDRLNQMGS